MTYDVNVDAGSDNRTISPVFSASADWTLFPRLFPGKPVQMNRGHYVDQSPPDRGRSVIHVVRVVMA